MSQTHEVRRHIKTSMYVSFRYKLWLVADPVLCW